MLNGKFYTGLPPKMIERSGGSGRDHQKTNFFWPDESDSKSVTANKPKKSTINNYTYNLPSPQCEPQQRFKKELTSKIQFYDLIDDNLNNTINRNDNVNNMKKNDKNYMKDKKHEALKSEIHDYDKFERNNKKGIGGNRTDLPKLINKRITFNDNDEHVHMKNNEMNKRPPIFKQRVGLINKNKSISKSVDNLPEKLLKNNSDQDDDDINIIENDVKNFKIPVENDYNDERDYEFEQRGHQHSNSNSTTKSAIQEIRRPSHDQNHNYEINNVNDRRFSKFQLRNNNSFNKDYFNYNQDNDVFYNQSRDKYNDNNNKSTRHIEIRLSPSRELIQKGKNNSSENDKRNYNHLSNKNNKMYGEISSKHKSQLNEQQQNKNRHLKSNIIFSDHIDNQQSSVPDRKTIRSSAVNRVSVGLPEL